MYMISRFIYLSLKMKLEEGYAGVIGRYGLWLIHCGTTYFHSLRPFAMEFDAPGSYDI